MSNKARAARWSFSKHQWLALVGGISLLIWGLSGLTHIWMVLFGPQQAVFMPPTRPVVLADARPIAETLADAGIARAISVRTVPGPETTLYQVTTTALGERRYFDPATGKELAGHDRRQAEFLARHYLKEARPVTDITLQTGFDDDYPWVNRQLPVWRVHFAGSDGLVAYVHTETGTLAAVNNDGKATQQRIFRWLHSWDWVPTELDWLRVIVITALVGSLAALAVTGVMMLVTIRRAKRLPGAKGWHRIAGYVLALPLLMFSTSGIYHLIQFALEPPQSQLRLPQPLDLAGGRYPIERDWNKVAQGRTVHSLSLIEGPKGQPLYRLDLGAAPAAAEHDHGSHSDAPPSTAAEIRKARFDGVQSSGPPLYVDATTGQPLPLADRDLALAVARRFAGPEAQVTQATLVTRFGADYDFRNKRLPVWKVDFGAPANASLFVDPATGILVDRVADWQKPERWFFSLIHKWNFLFPLGKLTLNIVVGSVVIALILLMAGIGLWLDWRGRKLRRLKPVSGLGNPAE
jgi:hypothetical protein